MEWFTKSQILATLIALPLGIFVCYNYDNEHIPATKQVQQGYADPSKLEIQVQDSDKDGNRETLMIYDGISYPIKLDEQGRPILEYGQSRVIIDD